jgi:hypothetical protein
VLGASKEEKEEETASPSGAGGLKRKRSGNGKRKTAFYCGGCKQRNRPT